MNQPTTLSKSLNPYKHIKLGTPECLRLSNDVDRTEANQIRFIAGDFGFLNATISRFVKHLYEHCQRNAYSFSDRDKLIAHVLAICPIDGDVVALGAGPTPSRPNGHGPDLNVGRPTEVLGAVDPRATDSTGPSLREQAPAKVGVRAKGNRAKHKV